jgi:hypothetical protein
VTADTLQAFAAFAAAFAAAAAGLLCIHLLLPNTYSC